MAKHKIGWLNRPGTTGETWNPITGCSPVSEGCQNCYAARMAKRLRGRFGYPEDDPFRVIFHADKLDQPLRWKKPRTIFPCSMGDLFHEDVRSSQIARVIEVMEQCPQHTFLALTKRPQRQQEFFHIADCWNLPNVWLGVTAENQATADVRIPLLLQTSAEVRWVSLEPLLEEIVLDVDWLVPRCPACGRHEPCGCERKGEWPEWTILDWLVVGAESGPGRRACKIEWVRDIVRQCKSAKVPVYVKQLDINGRVSKDMAEWPADLRVREFPFHQQKGRNQFGITLKPGQCKPIEIRPQRLIQPKTVK